MCRCKNSQRGDLEEILWVIADPSWRAWIEPFLQLEGLPSVIECHSRRDAVIESCGERPGRIAVLLSDHMSVVGDADAAHGHSGIIAQSRAMAQLAHDKRGMASLFEGCALVRPIPELDAAAAESWLRDGRCVVEKRCDGTRGQGLLIHRSIESLEAGPGDGSTILQPLLQGLEISLPMLFAGGRCWCYPAVEKGFSSVDFVHPSQRRRDSPLSAEHAVDLSGITSEVIEVLRPLSPYGPVEVELLVANGAIHLLELNPRLAATMRMSGIACNRSLFSDWVAASLGYPMPSGMFVDAILYTCELPLPQDCQAHARALFACHDNLWVSGRVTARGSTRAEAHARAAQAISIASNVKG